MDIKTFDLLAEILQVRPDSGAREAARLVLTEGWTQADARKHVAITRGTVSKIVVRMEDVDRRLSEVYGKARPRVATKV